MKKADIKNKTKAELETLLKDKRDTLKNFRFGVSGSRVKNIKEARTTRKDVARAITFLRQK
ncbi:MAG: 50S ribosomal protein L29 [Candidatus Vogelbacteria bacterium]|nr:50S ribosomal protein L29 [Candidatus Vogelbacteria bacterium]